MAGVWGGVVVGGGAWGLGSGVCVYVCGGGGWVGAGGDGKVSLVYVGGGWGGGGGGRVG